MHPRRSKHLNLFKINQPLPAVVSILHRISGTLLFFSDIPLVLCGMQLLLQSPESYEILIGYWQTPAIKGLLLLSLWFFLHHLCADIRFLYWTSKTFSSIFSTDGTGMAAQTDSATPAVMAAMFISAPIFVWHVFSQWLSVKRQ
ncbi:succinate dehydrogenase, cytochrome b556 subunit [Nitrosomonas sp. wSCUT-2]